MTRNIAVRETTCPVDGADLHYAGTGRPPRYCSQACRDRAAYLRDALPDLRAALGTWRAIGGRRPPRHVRIALAALEADIAIGERLARR